MPKLNAIVRRFARVLRWVAADGGLFSRFISPALIFTMIVAYVTADNEALRAAFSDPDKFTAARTLSLSFCERDCFCFRPGKNFPRCVAV